MKRPEVVGDPMEAGVKALRDLARLMVALAYPGVAPALAEAQALLMVKRAALRMQDGD
jgi:hypothetical protein